MPFLIQDNLTQGLRTGGAKEDVYNMLQIIKTYESDYPMLREVGIFGYFPETNNLGDTKLQQVVTVDYTTRRLNAINFGGITFDDIYGAASVNLSGSDWR